MEMSSNIYFAIKYLLTSHGSVWWWRSQRLAEAHMCRPGSQIFCFVQQQAIEDLQSEEEKVVQLTKEKTKLQMQAEDVSSSSVSTHYMHIFFLLC